MADKKSTDRKERHTLTDADRSAKLKELAPARVGRALRACKHIGQLIRYNPNANQKSAILAVLRTAVSNVESTFAGKVQADFELPT